MKWLQREMVNGPHLALATSEAEFQHGLRWLKVAQDKWPVWLADDSRACVHTFFHPNGTLACIVTLRPDAKEDGIDVACILVHEAVHVFQQWCRHYEEGAPSKEFEAYSIESISERLMRAYLTRIT